MESKDVLRIYNLLEKNGISIWIDGGWSVDALLGKQTRTHKDLDIAIESKDVSKFQEVLENKGFTSTKGDGEWNIIVRDDMNREIDVHIFIYDEKGEVVEGIMYPTESLKGKGEIDGQSVRCITPKYQIEFLAKWVHKWPEKYTPAIKALCVKFGMELPKEYTNLVKE